MKITEPYTGKSGVDVILEYSDADSFDQLPLELVRQAYGMCFAGDKMVIGWGGKKQEWGLIGGTIETGETFEETLKREIIEESNMEVIACAPVGYQKAINTSDGSFVLQLRYVCLVKPLGPFVPDPAGGITKIKLIDPKEFKQYFNWGRIGERIITRAAELKSSLQ